MRAAQKSNTDRAEHRNGFEYVIDVCVCESVFGMDAHAVSLRHCCALYLLATAAQRESAEVLQTWCIRAGTRSVYLNGILNVHPPPFKRLMPLYR